MYLKTCNFCQETFEARDRRTNFCKKPECQRARYREQHANHTITCTCKICGINYEATRKQNKELCPNCVRPKHYNFKETHFREVKCRSCGQILKVLERQTTNKAQSKPILKTCDKCLAVIHQQTSDRMKLNNPSYVQPKTLEEYLKDQQLSTPEEILQRQQENRARASIRMKIANPMFNEATRNKVKQTYSLKKSLGLIKKPDPKLRKNYKGDRGIKQYLRIAITWWRAENFERTSYKCEICGEHKDFLMVHHLEKFSTIVEKLAKSLHIDLKTLEFASELYYQLETEVIKYHKEHDIGLVVCEACHDSIDECFHKRKDK